MSARGVVASSLEKEKSALRHAVLAGLLVTLSTVGLSGTSAWLIVRSAQQPAVLSLTVPMGLVQLFALSKAAGRYVERTQMHRAALGVMGHVRAAVARLLEPLVPAGLGPRSTEVVDVVLGDVERVQDLLTAVAGPLITSVIAGLVTVVVVSIIVPTASLVLLVSMALTALALPLFAQRWGQRSESELDEVRRAMNSLFDRAAQSGDEYVLAGAASSLDDELELLERRFDRASHRRRAVMGLVGALSTLVSGACVVGVVAATSAALREGHVGVALLAVPALLSVTALELVGGVAPLLVGLRGDRAAMSRLESLASLVPPVREPLVAAHANLEATELCASDLVQSFDAHEVLSHASLRLVAGDVVLLTGPSGGGKTTFARLLAKFLDPDKGSLVLGATNFTELTSHQVRECVGFVDDAPHVFATSLAGNLRIAAPLATDDELLDALETAGLGALLATMSDGLDTSLGGPTTGLSGGEQRRLGIARELLARRRVVILDEPTEGLDEETAAKVVSRLVDHYRLGALLIISHRDGDLQTATRICELRAGSLHEFAVPKDVNTETFVVA